MKILVSLGPIIGVAAWAVYCACVQLYAAVKGKEAVKKRRKAILYIPACVMAVTEALKKAMKLI